ncbi:MAG TPA: cytochrome P450 [Candidatus Lustribacter sp.]|nr:cytochrome P450 [Candidatus Lustribacter sp.]
MRIATSHVDPFCDESLLEPYALHAELRDLGPVVRLEKYGVWAMARHADVYPMLNDWETFCSSAGVGFGNFHTEKPWRPPSLILEADPPLHTRTRAVLSRVLSTTALRRMRRTFEQRAAALVAQLVERGRFDAIADLAVAFPLEVFPDAVGLCADGRENLAPYGNAVFNANGPMDGARFASALSDAARVGPWILAQCRREALAPGGLGADVYVSVDSGEIAADEAALLVRSLLSAGLDTTVHGIGNALYCLATHPDQWALLHANPALARAAFEEALRFESPVTAFFRTTAKPVAVDGVALEAEEKVLAFFGAANRDPRAWEEPDRFDITRKAAKNVAFGAGIHFCVGAMLARLEAETILTALARRVRTIEPAGAPRRLLNNSLRGLTALPVAITA